MVIFPYIAAIFLNEVLIAERTEMRKLYQKMETDIKTIHENKAKTRY